MLNFDALLHGPVSAIFGEQGQGADLPVYQPQVGAAYPVDGVFDQAYIEADLLSGVGANTVENLFGARLAAFKAAPVQNDAITIPRLGKTFLVRDVQPDGHGWVQLRLSET
ncbi:head-tail joining protein [Pseudomonas fluorescens group sp. PF-69]